MNVSHDYLRALAVGAVSGLRSMSGPAIAERRNGSPAAAFVPIMALGEIIVDKFPGIPARTTLAPLIVRALAGGFAGWQITGDKADRRIGLVLGIAGAVAASYAGEGLRRATGKVTQLPDALVALIEDGIVLAASRVLEA